MKPRDYYRYELKDGHKVVYVGVTNEPPRRESEHRNEDKQISRMRIVGPAVTEDTAKRWEKERLQQYRQNHRGTNPKYNQTQEG